MLVLLNILKHLVKHGSTKFHQIKQMQKIVMIEFPVEKSYSQWHNISYHNSRFKRDRNAK